MADPRAAGVGVMAIDNHKIEHENEPAKPYALYRVLRTRNGVEIIKRLATFNTLEQAKAHERRDSWQYAVKHHGEIVWPPSLRGKRALIKSSRGAVRKPAALRRLVSAAA